MSYESATTTILLATHCCCCGRPLVDAISVELGIGPECRNGRNNGISEEQREVCNSLTHAAAIAAQEGNVEAVRRIANDIRNLGLATLADKVVSRFVNAERLAKIRIVLQGDSLVVETPYKRSMKAEFAAAWRAIPGRRWVNGRNVIPTSSKRNLWNLLKTFFPGEFGVAPTGTFKVPGEKKKKPA